MGLNLEMSRKEQKCPKMSKMTRTLKSDKKCLEITRNLIRQINGVEIRNIEK